MIARVSNKGHITLPARFRRMLGIAVDSQVDITISAHELTIRPIKPVSELAGVLNRYARPGAVDDWDSVRAATERAVAEEVIAAHARRVRGGR